MSDATTATSEKSAGEVSEDLIKAALTHGIAGLMTQGLGISIAAIRKAKADGLAVYITAAFMPDGQVLVLEPQVERLQPTATATRVEEPLPSESTRVEEPLA